MASPPTITKVIWRSMTYRRNTNSCIATMGISKSICAKVQISSFTPSYRKWQLFWMTLVVLWRVWPNNIWLKVGHQVWNWHLAEFACVVTQCRSYWWCFCYCYYPIVNCRGNTWNRTQIKWFVLLWFSRWQMSNKIAAAAFTGDLLSAMLGGPGPGRAQSRFVLLSLIFGRKFCSFWTAPW